MDNQHDKSEEFQMINIKSKSTDTFVSKQRPQVLASLAASFAAFSLGTCVAWSSPSIPDLEKREVFGVLSIEQKSWIASIVTLGALLCGPFSGFIVDKLGRRASVMVLALPMIVGWALISSGLSVPVMCIGRFLTGFSTGGNLHVSTIYISEIAEEKIRGLLISITCIQCGLGILYIYILGSFASWFILSITNLIPPIILLVGMYLVPESPIHLLNIGKKQEAIKALVWLRGAKSASQVQQELEKLHETSSKIPDGNDPGESLWKALSSKNSLKALAIVLALMMCQQLCGINAVLFYGIAIFEAAGTGINENLSSIIIGLAILFSAFLNFAFVERVGRRVLMMISMFGMAVSVFCIGTFFYVKSVNDGLVPSGLAPMPLVSLLAFMVFYNLGAGPVSFLLMGELFPLRIRGFGCSLATSFNWLLAFVVTKTFESLTIQLEIHGCFFLFGVLCLLGFAFCLFFVPETKGKSFNEIQAEYFSN